MTKQRPELSHALVLVRASINGPKNEELGYLLNSFNKMPVSIYSLPDFNMYDFALVGSLSDALVDAKIVQAKHPNKTDRFDRVQAFYGDRYVYHGTTLDHADTNTNIRAKMAALKDEKSWEKGSPRFYGMLLLELKNLANEGLRREIRTKLDYALKEAACAPTYCLSRIWSMDNIQKEPPARGNIEDFSVLPVTQCTCWVRFFMDIGSRRRGTG